MTLRPIQWRSVWFPAGLLVILALAVWINLPLGTRLVDHTVFTAAQRLPPLPAFRSGQRLLLLSSHPDDETLCCAGLIQQASAAGAQVFVTWVTPGDGFELDGALVARQVDPPTPPCRIWPGHGCWKPTGPPTDLVFQ